MFWPNSHPGTEELLCSLVLTDSEEIDPCTEQLLMLIRSHPQPGAEVDAAITQGFEIG